MPVRTAYPKETKETAKALYLQGFTAAVIAVQLNVKPATINKWREHGQWVRIRDGTLDKAVARGMTILTRESTRQLEQASSALREQFSNLLQKGAETLGKAPLVESIGHVRDFGEALEPLVRSAKIVHGWGTEGPTGIILGDLLGEERQAQSSIEIAASVEQPACGLEATTGSVPQCQPTESIPQDAQVPIDKPQAQ